MKEKKEYFNISINDDFDLEKIATCGQCFRVKHLDGNRYRFIKGMDVLYISSKDHNLFEISCDEQTWNDVWAWYFDLERNYYELRNDLKKNCSFIEDAIEHGCGLRVLRQNAWEMVITFIISQRKSIPAIAKAVENLAQKFGTLISTEYETLYAFPTPEQLSEATVEELDSCGLGYRTAYVMDAVKKIAAGVINLTDMNYYNDDELFTTLMDIHGVGKKVSNCICLFGYGRMSRVPVDVWISRAIQEEFQGRDPFEKYGSIAGIIQQYVFYYEKNHYKRGLAVKS